MRPWGCSTATPRTPGGRDDGSTSLTWRELPRLLHRGVVDRSAPIHRCLSWSTCSGSGRAGRGRCSTRGRPSRADPGPVSGRSGRSSPMRRGGGSGERDGHHREGDPSRVDDWHSTGEPMASRELTVPCVGRGVLSVGSSRRVPVMGHHDDGHTVLDRKLGEQIGNGGGRLIIEVARGGIGQRRAPVRWPGPRPWYARCRSPPLI